MKLDEWLKLRRRNHPQYTLVEDEGRERLDQEFIKEYQHQEPFMKDKDGYVKGAKRLD